ncbi:MAG: hypothetical protein ACI4EK_06305 [Wujia sp.]
MDIERHNIEDLQCEYPQMPDFIRDMIGETVDEQIYKKQRNSSVAGFWKSAAAVLVCICLAGGTAFAATKLYKMHLEKQGKYGSTVVYEAQTETDADDGETAMYTLDVNYIPEGMIADGLEDYDIDGNNIIPNVCIFSEDTPFIGGVSFSFQELPSSGEYSFDRTHVIDTKEFEIDGNQAVCLEHPVTKSSNPTVQYELCVTLKESNYLLDMFIYDDMELDTAIDIVKGLKLTKTSDPHAQRLVKAAPYEELQPEYEEYVEPDVGRFTKATKEDMCNLHQVGDSFALTHTSMEAKVSSVQLLDRVEDIHAVYQTDPVEVDADGKLVNNTVSYIKSGDGIDTLNEVVGTKEFHEKILYINIEYTNTSTLRSGDTLFHCDLLWAQETEDGYETKDVYARKDITYDYYLGQNYHVGGCPIYYYNGTNVDDKNHLINMEPGETRTVTYAFLISEEELPYLFLDLSSGLESHMEFSQKALMDGYVDIRQVK